MLATKTNRAVRIFTGCRNDALYVGSGQRSADDLLRRTSWPVFAVYILRKTTMIISCSMTVGLQVSWYWNHCSHWRMGLMPSVWGSRHKTGWGVRRMPLLRPFPLEVTPSGADLRHQTYFSISRVDWWLERALSASMYNSKLSRFRVRFRVSNLVLVIGQDFRVRISVRVIIDRRVSPIKWWRTSCVFTALRYASALYAVVVCPSVRQTPVLHQNG